MGSNLGILIMRIGLGVMFIYHGFPKMRGGPATWAELGTAMGYLGITFMPVVWGFLAACAEFIGGLCLIMGILYKPATVMLTVTMIVASLATYGKTHSISEMSHAAELAVVFLGLFMIGPGKFKFAAVG